MHSFSLLLCYQLVSETRSVRLPLSELKSLISISQDDVLKDAFTINFTFVPHPEFSTDPSNMILCVSSAAIDSSVTRSPLLALNGVIWFKGCHIEGELTPNHHEPVIDGIRLEEIFVDQDDGVTSSEANIIDDTAADELFARAADVAESTTIATNFILHTQSSIQGPLATVSQTSVTPPWEDEIPPTPKSLDVPISNYLDELWV